MSVSSATLRRLAALRLNADQMEEVLSILADQVQADEERKAQQAARKRRQREIVTGQSRDSHRDSHAKKEAVFPRPLSEEKNSPPSAPKGASVPPLDEFEAWWREVPRKVSKGQARRAYRTARKRVGAETLLTGIRRYADEVRVRGSPEYTKHPATWLNGECWNDDPMEIASGPRRNPDKKSPHDKMLAGFLAAARDG